MLQSCPKIVEGCAGRFERSERIKICCARTVVAFALFAVSASACDTTDGETEVVTGVTATVHPTVSTILVVQWRQNAKSDNVWLRFTFENGEYFESPKKTGLVGDHSEVILGVPSETEVTFYIVHETDGEEVESQAIVRTTGALPGEMPRPTLVEYNAALAGPQRWNLGSVENSQSPASYYGDEFWIYIIDRQARIVWYYKDPLNARILFPSVSQDNTHILYDTSNYTGEGHVSLIQRTSLDLEYFEEIDIDDMSWAFAETATGEIIYSTVQWMSGGSNLLFLNERQADGTVHEIWNCQSWVASLGVKFDCYSNTVNWIPSKDTVLISMPHMDTVLEIARSTGAIVGQWGETAGSWDFIPDTVGFNWNHYPTITPEGTFLVSTHLPEASGPGDHRIMEFEIDSENEVLEEVWSYGEEIEDWPVFSGEATRLENGNTLINYGSGGSIREVTPDKETAWHVLWDGDFPEEYNNLLCGHNVFVNDLYALNRGPGKK